MPSEYYLKNKKRLIQGMIVWNKAHPENVKRNRKRRYAKQKIAYDEWRKNNPDKLTGYMKKYWSNNGQSYRYRLLDILGDRCVNPNCLVPGGCIDKRCLQIDHINGGGKKEFIRFGTGNGMYRYYINNPDEAKKNLQILCANCNWIKRQEKKENGGNYSKGSL